MPRSAASDLAGVRNVRIAGAEPVALRNMRAISFAAPNGPAVGAGFGLALARDIRFAATKAYFKASYGADVVTGRSP